MWIIILGAPYVPLYYPYQEDQYGLHGMPRPPGSASPYGGLSVAQPAPADRLGGPVSTTTANRGTPPPSSPPGQPIDIRTEFPETWIFDSFDFNSR